MKLGILPFVAFVALQAACFGQCSKDADCKGDRVCIDGVCTAPPPVLRCSKDKDCPGDMICNNGVCVHPSSIQSNPGGHSKVPVAPTGSSPEVKIVQRQPASNETPPPAPVQNAPAAISKGTALSLICQSSKNEYLDQTGALFKIAKKEIEKTKVFSGIAEGAAAQADYALTLTIVDIRKISRGTRIAVGMAAGPAMISLMSELKDQSTGAVLMKETIEESSVGFGMMGATTETVMKNASEKLAGMISRQPVALGSNREAIKETSPAPLPDPVDPPGNSNPGLQHGCTANSFLINGTCVDGHLVATAGNAVFVVTDIFYTLSTLAASGFSIWGGFDDPTKPHFTDVNYPYYDPYDGYWYDDWEYVQDGVQENGDQRSTDRYTVALPVSLSPVLFEFLNQIPLSKERGYLNQLGVTEGQGLYRATWIMDLACVGTTGLLAASYACEGTGVSGTMSIIDAAAVLTNCVLHMACNAKQRGLLQSRVNSTNTQQSEHNEPSLAPYASVEPHKGWKAGLALSF
jgi:hypothetical protein